MKCFFRTLLYALPVLTLSAVCGVSTSLANAELQRAKAQAAAQEEEPESPPGYEKEYEAWENAEKETDLLKRGSMVIAAITEFPKSTLIPNFEATYKRTLSECYASQKFQELETLAEQWLKLHPNDFETIARIADAAVKLGHDDKYVQRLADLYKMKPTADLANDIAQTYKRMKNKAKYLEWVETALKHPENDSNFMLRLDLVQTYMEAKDLSKALEWSQATLKSTDLVKNPSAEVREQLRAVRHACNDIIAKILYGQDKYAEARKAFQQAIKLKKYDEGYYYVGLCLHAQRDAETAMLWYAKAIQEGGEFAPKAKENLEKIYKSLHNDTLIGIEKVYKKAQEQPETFWMPAN